MLIAAAQGKDLASQSIGFTCTPRCSNLSNHFSELNRLMPRGDLLVGIARLHNIVGFVLSPILCMTGEEGTSERTIASEIRNGLANLMAIASISFDNQRSQIDRHRSGGAESNDANAGTVL